MDQFWGSASDWLNQISHAARPIRSTRTQIWVVTCHPYGISALVSQTSFGGETSGGVAKCRLFSQATSVDAVISSLSVFLFCWFPSLIYSQPSKKPPEQPVCPCSHSRTRVFFFFFNFLIFNQDTLSLEQGPMGS